MLQKTDDHLGRAKGRLESGTCLGGRQSISSLQVTVKDQEALPAQPILDDLNWSELVFDPKLTWPHNKDHAIRAIVVGESI
jgi:hypothetical protein